MESLARHTRGGARRETVRGCRQTDLCAMNCVLRTVCYELCAGLLARSDRSTGCATAAATAEAECRLGPAAGRDTLPCSNERRGCAMCCVLRTVCYGLCATAPPVPSRLLQACVQHHHCRRLSLGSPPFQVFALLLLLLLLQEEEEEVETTCSSGTVGQLPSSSSSRAHLVREKLQTLHQAAVASVPSNRQHGLLTSAQR